MWVLIELRCEWNSFTCSLCTHTWLSSTYLNHHLGGFGADMGNFTSGKGTNMGDFTSALQSHQRALAIRIKLFGEELERTADSCS